MRRYLVTVTVAVLLAGALVCASAPCRAQSGWTSVPTGESVDLRGIAAVDGDTAWAVGYYGTVLKTTDGGATWDRQAQGKTSEHLYGVCAVDSSNAFAVGANGTVLRTSDGENWQKQDSSTDNHLQGVSAVNANVAWAVGYDGTIIETVNGGTQWTAQEICSDYLWDVYAFDKNTAWAVGNNGRIFATSNGISWNAQDSGTDNNLRGVSGADSETLWAVGTKDGTILKTENGGDRWFRQTPPTEEFLYGVAVSGPDNAWAVGEHGRILRTVDGGSHWFEQSVTTADLWAVSAAGTKDGWASGHRGLALRTLDGGGPPTRWYLAEGSTLGGFETWVLVQNPGEEDVTVDLTLNTDQGEMRPDGLQDQQVPAGSRVSFPVHAFVQTYDVSTVVESSGGGVVCERSVYWTPPGSGLRVLGTDSVGATATANRWYLAEGSTLGGFETWVLVQNPGDGAVHVNLTLNTESGEEKPPALQNQEVPAGSRRSFPIHQYVQTYDVSTTVEALDGRVVCERSVYWTPPGSAQRVLGTDSVGATATSNRWYLAEGSTLGGFETWVLVQNPGEESVRVNLKLNTDSGTVEPDDLQLQEVPAGGRRSFPIHEFVQTYDVSTEVEAVDGEIVCERSVYWTPPGSAQRVLGTDSIGSTLASRRWYLAEGSTLGGFETWVLVQNPGDEPVMVDLTLNTDQGAVSPDALQDQQVPAGSRVSFPIHQYAQTYDVSTTVSADAPVVCERSVYWTPPGLQTRVLGTDSIGCDP